MSRCDLARAATEQTLRGTSRRASDGLCKELIGTTFEPSFGHDGSTIASLPCGVLSHVFNDLGPRDLASASCVCRAWRRLVALEAAANQVWRSFYSARWQLSGARWPSRPQINSNTDNLGICASLPLSFPDNGRGDPRIIRSSACTGTSASSPSAFSSTTPAESSEMRWQWAYGSKMLRLRSWSGRYSADQVVGHKMAVRAVRLLPACDLMAAASLDRTVRLWDLRSGLSLGHSRPHDGTVRCLALDTGLLASGSSDTFVRVWRPQTRFGNDVGGLSETASLFSISSKPYILRGHGGPVSCLALDESPVMANMYGGAGGGSGEVYSGTLFSGSWDCTVRIWQQGAVDSSDGGSGGDDDGIELSDGSGGGIAGSSGDEQVSRYRQRESRQAARPEAEDGGWACVGVLQYSDWVYCCAVRGGNLLVAAGSEVVVTDAVTGRAMRRFADVHDGAAVACLEGCRSGRLLFTASGDGLILAHDLRMKQGSRVLWHHNAAVTGLAFEDPWLASSSADGCIILQDSEQALAGGSSPQRALSASCRALHCPMGQPALCLDLADQWLAAGTDSGVVRLWDFTGAAAAAERAAAARAARSVAKFTQASSPHYQQHHHVPSQLLPPMTQLNIQQTQQQKQQRRRRSKRHEPLQQKLEAVDQLQIPANESASALEGKVVDNSRSSPAADSAAAAEPAPAARNRSRCGSGGSSSDRRRHHGNLQSSGPTFPRTRGPRPPLAPMAPAFRYLGSGVGGGNGTGGGGGGPVPSTMSTISSPSQQRPPRTQR